MGVKETIAFLGEAGTICPVLMEKLAKPGYRLLFVSDEVRDVNLQEIKGDIEVIHCAKEGCWEADIIALVDPEEIGTEMVKRIKDVATQKIVLCIETEENKKSCFTNTHLEELQADFPYSKLVYIKVDTQQMTVQLHGRDQEAMKTVLGIFEASGYQNESVTVNE